LSDGRPSGTVPVLARDLRVWVEELERLQRTAELADGEDYAASAERASALVDRIRRHWRPGVGTGVAGVELVRPVEVDDFYATWRGSRPPAGAPILVTLLPPESLGHGHLLARFLDGLESVELLTRRAPPSPHVARAQQIDESMLAWTSEFPEGGTFADGLGRGLPQRAKVALLLEAARGLAHAHANGVVHGGLRPDSVGMRSDGTVFMQGFGLTRRGGDRLPPRDDPRGAFVAPEVAAGAAPDPRSDVYAFGRLALAVLCDLDVRSNLAHRLSGLDLSVLPADLGPVLRRATAADPSLRQADGRGLLRELETGRVSMPLMSMVASGELARPRPRWARPIPLLVVSVASVVLFGVFAVPHWFVPEVSSPRSSPPPVAVAPSPSPAPSPTATPTPEITREVLEQGLARYLPRDVPDPYGALGDEALSARLLFLDQAEELRDRIAARVETLAPQEEDPAALALMAWALERRRLAPDSVATLRDRLGQRRRVLRVGSVDVGFARLPGEPERWIGTREVSQALWAEVVGEPSAVFRGPELPIESVSWCDAVAFTAALAQIFELPPAYAGSADCDASGARSVAWAEDAPGPRLPTAAEWDVGAGGGLPGRSWMGDAEQAIARVGWLAPNSGNRTHPAGQLAENPWGLADVHGNVAEWLWEPAADPEAEVRWVSVRGGSWRSRVRDARRGERTPMRPEARGSDVGLRLLWQGPLPGAEGDDDSAE
jgi:sulfatase modifying factor 1